MITAASAPTSAMRSAASDTVQLARIAVARFGRRWPTEPRRESDGRRPGDGGSSGGGGGGGGGGREARRIILGGVASGGGGCRGDESELLPSSSDGGGGFETLLGGGGGGFGGGGGRLREAPAGASTGMTSVRRPSAIPRFAVTDPAARRGSAARSLARPLRDSHAGNGRGAHAAHVEREGHASRRAR